MIAASMVILDFLAPAPKRGRPAKNAAEIAACSDVSPPKTGVPIAAASVVGVPPPGGGYTSVPYEECIVDAENAAEIAACAE